LVGTDRPFPWGSRSAIGADPSSWEHRRLRCRASAGIVKQSPYDEKEFAASLQKLADSAPPTWRPFYHEPNGSPKHEEVDVNLARPAFKSSDENRDQKNIGIERVRRPKKIEQQRKVKNKASNFLKKPKIKPTEGKSSNRSEIGGLDRAIEIETNRLRKRVQRIRKAKSSKEKGCGDSILDRHCIDTLKGDLSILEDRCKGIHRGDRAGIVSAARRRAIEILLGELGADQPADHRPTSLTSRSVEQDEAQAKLSNDGSAVASIGAPMSRGPTSAPATVQNALSALSAARKRYYGQD
jgi:hypothetical protein